MAASGYGGKDHVLRDSKEVFTGDKKKFPRGVCRVCQVDKVTTGNSNKRKRPPRTQYFCPTCKQWLHPLCTKPYHDDLSRYALPEGTRASKLQRGEMDSVLNLRCDQ